MNWNPQILPRNGWKMQNKVCIHPTTCGDCQVSIPRIVFQVDWFVGKVGVDSITKKFTWSKIFNKVGIQIKVGKGEGKVDESFKWNFSKVLQLEVLLPTLSAKHSQHKKQMPSEPWGCS